MSISLPSRLGEPLLRGRISSDLFVGRAAIDGGVNRHQCFDPRRMGSMREAGA